MSAALQQKYTALSVGAADPANLQSSASPIRDILRTKCCVPDSVFLVEAIDTAIPTTDRHKRVVRLMLGDGELCIQALCGQDMHNAIDSKHIRVGCYVRVKAVEVRVVKPNLPVGMSVFSGAVAVLLVRDMEVVGQNTGFTHLVTAQTTGHTDQTRQSAVEANANIARASLEPHAKFQGYISSKAATDEADEDAFEVMDVSETAAIQRRRQSSLVSVSNHANDRLPWTAEDLSRPLKLTALGAIPHLPYKQNWVVNVLAVVASISDIEPVAWPPYKQRTARLADPTADKQVLLTVFLDPEAFVPTVGSVVLLLGVKNHVAEGGSLKKYANERPKNGARWWYENPEDLSWCDVAGLRNWWTRLRQTPLNPLAVD